MTAKRIVKDSIAESKVTRIFLGILVVIAVGFVLHLLQSILKPFFIAIFLSYLFEPMIEALKKLKIPRTLAIILVLIFAFLIFDLMGLLVYASIDAFSEEFPKYEARFRLMFQGVITYFKIPTQELDSYLKQIDWPSALQNLSVASFVTASVGSFVNFLGKLFLVLLLMIYILVGRDNLTAKIGKAFVAERSQRINETMNHINRQMQKYLLAKTLVSLANGILVGVVLLLFGVDFAVIWGLLNFILNFIPNIGSILGTVPPLIVALIQFGSLWPVVWVTLLLVTTQMIMGNVVEPRVMGRSLNLSPLVVILFLIFWGFLWGVTGMILAVPIAVTIQIVLANIESLRPISVLMGGE